MMRFFDRRQTDKKGRRFLHILLDLCFFQPLDKDLDPPVREPEHTHDLRYDTYAVDPVGQGVFVGKVLLRGHDDKAVLRKGFFDGVNGHVPAHKQREAGRSGT